MAYLELLCVSSRHVYCTSIYCCSVQRMDLQPNVTRRRPWSSASSSWPAQPGSDGGTGSGASSHIACRTSWYKRDCSPDMGRRGEVLCSKHFQFDMKSKYAQHQLFYLRVIYKYTHSHIVKITSVVLPHCDCIFFIYFLNTADLKI